MPRQRRGKVGEKCLPAKRGKGTHLVFGAEA